MSSYSGDRRQTGCHHTSIDRPLGVEICISNDKNRYVPWQTRLSTVTIAGSRPSVLECKTVVSCLLKHYHHELTHPGVTHATLEIHTKDNGLIIGDKGSELRHIQNNWKVRVIVPNFQPDKLNDVVVVGEPRNAKRAAEYIGRMLTRKRQELKEALEDGHDSDEAEFVVADSRRTHESVTNRAVAQRAHRHHEQHYKGAKNELHRVKAYNEHGDEIPRGREHHVHEVDSRKRDLARGRERDAKYEA